MILGTLEIGRKMLQQNNKSPRKAGIFVVKKDRQCRFYDLQFRDINDSNILIMLLGFCVLGFGFCFLRRSDSLRLSDA